MSGIFLYGLKESITLNKLGPNKLFITDLDLCLLRGFGYQTEKSVRFNNNQKPFVYFRKDTV